MNNPAQQHFALPRAGFFMATFPVPSPGRADHATQSPSGPKTEWRRLMPSRSNAASCDFSASQGNPHSLNGLLDVSQRVSVTEPEETFAARAERGAG